MPQGFARAADGGLFYTETNWAHTIREPFNAVTAVLFLVIAVVWLARLRGCYREQGIVVLCLALLVVGGIGGALYHALRVSRIFLVMDFLPILLITLILSLHLWWRVLADRVVLAASLLAFFGLNRFLMVWVPTRWAINASYTLIAIAILTPLLVLLSRSHWQGARAVWLALSAFAIGLFFRIADPLSGRWLPMGTHWLWHLCSAASVWWLIGHAVRIGRAATPSSARARP